MAVFIGLPYMDVQFLSFESLILIGNPQFLQAICHNVFRYCPQRNVRALIVVIVDSRIIQHTVSYSFLFSAFDCGMNGVDGESVKKKNNVNSSRIDVLIHYNSLPQSRTDHVKCYALKGYAKFVKIL